MRRARDEEPADQWMCEMLAHLHQRGKYREWVVKEPRAWRGLMKMARREQGLAAKLLNDWWANDGLAAVPTFDEIDERAAIDGTRARPRTGLDGGASGACWS